MKSNKELDSILDKVVSEISNDTVAPKQADAAAERVWARLSAEGAATRQVAGTPVERIESCHDFQSLIPSYLNGSLSEARSLLLMDHTHECIPCRRAMKDARTGVAPKKQVTARRRYSIQPVVLRWGIAAVLVIGFTLLAIPLLQRYWPFGNNLEATVQAAEGQVYHISETKSALVVAGERLQKGDRKSTRLNSSHSAKSRMPSSA